MNKRLYSILLFLLLIVPLLVALPSVYFRLNDRCTLVDLESNKFLPHSMNSIYDDVESITDSAGRTNNGYYYYEQSLATIGVIEVATLANSFNVGEASLRVTLTADNSWCYTLIEDRRYKRKVAIDLFARGTSVALNADTNIDIGGGKTGIHVTEGTPDTVTYKIIENGTNIYKSAWFDVSLVMDELTDDDLLIAADSYYIINLTFEVSVIDGDGNVVSFTSGNTQHTLTETYIVQIMGYYRPEDDELYTDNTAIFYIERLVGDINISDEFGEGWIDVASYYFTTSSQTINHFNSSNPGCVYIFLSSSSDGTNTNASKFTLKRKRGPTIEGQSDFADEVDFVARLKSDGTGGFGHAYGSSTTLATAETDGSVYFSKTDTYETDKDFKAKSLVIGPDISKDKQGTNVRWHDQGTIQLRIPNDPSLVGTKSTETGDVDILMLKAGSYESRIYVHIVTDFIPHDSN